MQWANKWAQIVEIDIYLVKNVFDKTNKQHWSMAPFITDCVQMQEEMGQNIDLPKKYFVSNVENAGECRND